MTLFDALFILSGIFFGIVGGIIPSIGMTFTLVMLFPFIIGVSFDSLIAFYISAYISTFFSNSVVALWAGIAGDPTSFPILYERKNIFDNNLIGTALKRTAQASIITSLFSLVLMVIFIEALEPLISFFIASLTSATLFLLMLLMSLFWSKNRKYINICLTIFGLSVGLVGYQQHLGYSILTFDQYYLYSGIPLMPVIVGVYAIPILIDAIIHSLRTRHEEVKKYSFIIPKENVNLGPVFRGGLIGFIIGLIPIIGTSVASNISYFFESKIKNSGTLNRITSAEAANNASAIAVLLPLLTIGIAIIPSEMIMVIALENGGWSTKDITISTYIHIFIFSIITCLVCYKLCVNYVAILMQFFIRFQYLVMLFFSLLLCWGMYIQGYKSLQEYFYLIIFLIATIFGMLLKKLDISPIPFIISFIVGNIGLPVFLRSIQIIRYILIS